MSYTRQIGYLVSRAIEQDPAKKDQFLSVLNMTPEDLDNLCVGRLIPTLTEEDKIVEILGLHIPNRAQYDADAYQSVVHCMTPFSDTHNLDTIMDFIDAYIDAKETLTV